MEQTVNRMVATKKYLLKSDSEGLPTFDKKGTFDVEVALLKKNYRQMTSDTERHRKGLQLPPQTLLKLVGVNKLGLARRAVCKGYVISTKLVLCKD